ncbi:hypothetical protein FS837_007492, partial [Tulasnella sp. UAMH 9824]
MADFASLHLSEYALAWYFRLSPEVQQDWPQLQAAFTEKVVVPRRRLSFGVRPIALHIMFSECLFGFRLLGVPTAADSPSQQIDLLERAVLKVVEAGKEEARYVTMRPDAKGFGPTSNAGEAL